MILSLIVASRAGNLKLVENVAAHYKYIAILKRETNRRKTRLAKFVEILCKQWTAYVVFFF